jgi:hypothetical protein
MTHWDEIRCREGHTEHATRPVVVDLSQPHGYHDLPLVPERFHRRFTMHIYDWRQYRKAKRYCPGHDAVSETIDQHGIWEPAETILTLAACAGADPNGWVYDYGAQIGWFSALAASSEHANVVAYDADKQNLRLVLDTERVNKWRWIHVHNERIGPDSEPISALLRVTLLKIDVEGAERDVLRVRWPQITAGLVDHLLVEISPVFADYYPDLVCDLLDVGYRCWQVPEKNKHQRPVLDDIEHDLIPWRLDTLPRGDLRAWIAAQHQFNAWFALPEARFG